MRESGTRILVHVAKIGYFILRSRYLSRVNHIGSNNYEKRSKFGPLGFISWNPLKYRLVRPYIIIRNKEEFLLKKMLKSHKFKPSAINNSTLVQSEEFNGFDDN